MQINKAAVSEDSDSDSISQEYYSSEEDAQSYCKSSGVTKRDNMVMSTIDKYYNRIVHNPLVKLHLDEIKREELAF